MTQVAKRDNTALAAHATENELIDVLSSSLYPGASVSSIKLVLGYCKAAGLDPLQKPVHIVPMWDAKSRLMRDVVMPGIGLYRIQAARTGCAGISEPEFGPDVTEIIGGQEITYPAWCKVTVKRRLATGEVAEFTAKEFWRENYAVKGGQEKSVAPNAMWTKRPYGQLSKCAQSQALRIGFPEVGAAPTAEEMEGKPLYEDDAVVVHAAPAPARPSLEPYPDDRFMANLPAWRNLIQSGRKTAGDLIAMIGSKGSLSAEQIRAIRECEVVDAEQPQTEQGEI